MKIESIRIQNFRSFVDETIPLNQYTGLVGPNGAGKSTILIALNVFFRHSENSPHNLSQLQEEDFHRRDTASPICITVTFSDLNKEAKKDFADYVRQDKLVISAKATFDEKTGNAEVKQFGQRLGITEFGEFFVAAAAGRKVAELKKIYESLQSKFPKLPSVGPKAQMMHALHDYESQNPELCTLIPSSDQFYGFSGGTNRLAKHIQWVYVPAVKDASAEQVEEKNSALGKLLARTVRSKTNFNETINDFQKDVRNRYQQILDTNQDTLNEISNDLQRRLSEWAHPDVKLNLEWKQDSQKSVRIEEPWAHVVAGEGEFQGQLARFGHGFQRSYILVLLQVLAEVDDQSQPTLILACEEPELYQHPPQARHLSHVLSRLSERNAQVVVSTHEPLFVSGNGFPDIRMVRKDSKGGQSSVSYASASDISNNLSEFTGKSEESMPATLAKVHQALQYAINEMFFTTRLVLVEGVEDIAYLTTYLYLLEVEKEVRRLGINFVPTNGKSNMIRPAVVAKLLNIPTYVIFDADSDFKDHHSKGAMHKAENEALLRLAQNETIDAFPTSNVHAMGMTIWRTNIESVVEKDIGKPIWHKVRQDVDVKYGHASKLRKNTLHIADCLIAAWNRNYKSKNLIKVCKAILNERNYISR
ncbi:MAG: AAA family ATPase [Gammaproteobacteria bacterium]|nr:AAA family ATPase [Gammaproteobacteria bacterium]